MKFGNGHMPTYKDTLMTSLELDPVNIDLSKAYGIPAKEYMQVLYYMLYQKCVARDEEERFRIEDYNSEDEYKSAVLKDAFESTERAIHKKVVFNYMDFSDSNVETVGKFKSKIRRTTTKINAAIPLEQKRAVKKDVHKIIK